MALANGVLVHGPTAWACAVRTDDGELRVAARKKRFRAAEVETPLLRGPARIAAQLVAAKQTTDQCAGALGQRLLEEYIRRGWMDEQLEESRQLYAVKAARLVAAFERELPRGVRWTMPRGGFFSWLTISGNAALLARRAVEHGVGIVPGALFFADGRGRDNVRISFSLVDEAQIDEGIKQLAALL